MFHRFAARAVLTLAVGVGATGCSASTGVEGLDADSTCSEWVEAPRDQQDSVVVDLVTEASGGQRNPMREANALMQFTSVCAAAPDRRLGDVAI